MSGRGTFRVARDIFDHPALCGDPFSRVSAWLWLVSEAAWDARTVTVAQRVIDLSRGQLAYSLRYLAEKWNWEHKRVDRFLAKMRKEGMIQTDTEAGITVMTIVQYEQHQTPEGAGQRRDSDGTAGGTANGTAGGTGDNSSNHSAAAAFNDSDLLSGTGGDTTINTPLGEGLAEKRHKTKEQINKRKNICARQSDDWPPDGFERFYEIYPRKKQRKGAEKAFNNVQASGDVTFHELIVGTERFAKANRKTDQKFIPYPATWLNKGGYGDSEDEALGAQGTLDIPKPRDPKTFTTAEWGERLAYLNDGNKWNSFWGPAPGQPGCLVPAPLINKVRGNGTRNVA